MHDADQFDCGCCGKQCFLRLGEFEFQICGAGSGRYQASLENCESSVPVGKYRRDKPTDLSQLQRLSNPPRSLNFSFRNSKDRRRSAARWAIKSASISHSKLSISKRDDSTRNQSQRQLQKQQKSHYLHFENSSKSSSEVQTRLIYGGV